MVDNALSGPALEALRGAVRESPLVASSTLAGSFRGSRGFAVIFTAPGREKLSRRFPALAPFLALALEERPRATLWRLLARPLPAANAFYLNVLILSAGARIGRHVDGTLRGPSGVETVLPRRVSVLYLSVPGGPGGELRLWRGSGLVATVLPVPGRLVHFRGALDHEVAPLDSGGGERISVVCEQYHLPPAALARVEPIALQSKAGFAAHLEDAGRAGPGGLELD